MENSKINLRFGVVVLMILVAALSRLLPHLDNFTPIAGIALFGAAHFARKYWAFIVTFVAMWLSDLYINNVVFAGLFPESYTGWMWMTPGWYWMYGSFALIIILGLLNLKKITVNRVLLSSAAASILFYLITNFGVWLQGMTYPMTGGGLLACMTAGLPYLQYTFIGDLFYCTVLFGSYEWVKNQYFAPTHV